MSLKSILAYPFAYIVKLRNDRWIKNPLKFQKKTFHKLIKKAKKTTFGIDHIDLKAESKKLKEQNQTDKLNTDDLVNNNSSSDYAHLHNNSQFSVLQSTTKISDLVKKTAEYKMNAVALTDKANMMGCFHFYRAVKNYNE